ncbi:MAG: ATP-binding cassette domain-containing protein [Lachnospiraceae bacterium]|nr:ATP-binding cassette domain-containing protein [Lachnospiraceae bacterium]
MISIQNMHKYFRKGRADEVHVINGTTLTFPETGFVCILGESGSGKTTLLNAIGGLDDFDRGRLNADGTVITAGRGQEKKLERLRNSRYAYIFQNYYLLGDRTVGYNVGLALNMYDLSEEEKQERIDYVLRAVDMWKYKKRPAGSLSGGQQQRVAIARALVKSPEVIFADEPTGNLDSVNTIRIMNILKKISETCLVIMVTHERNLAGHYADRILSVENGCVISDRVQEQGTSGEMYEDTNLYLKEYRKEVFRHDGLEFHYYRRHGKEEAGAADAAGSLPGLTLRIIYDNGRFYLETPEDDKTILIEKGGFRQVLDEERPSLQELAETVSEYSLLPPAAKKEPGLTRKEFFKLVFGNFRAAGKKQAVLLISLVVMAVLCVVAAADITTLKALDIDSVVKADSRQVLIKAAKNQGYGTSEYKEYVSALFDELEASGLVDSFQFYFQTDLTYNYQGFAQLEGLKSAVSGFSYAPLERISQEQLLYGRMPESPDEIVLDVRVANNFLKADNALSAVITEPRELIGKEITIARKEWTLKIVGICDSGEPDLYINKYVRLSLPTWVGNFAGLSDLQKQFPGQFDDVTLAVGEVLVSEKYYEQMALVRQTERIDTSLGYDFVCVGTYPAEFGFDFVISEECYKDLLRAMMTQAKEFLVETSDKEGLYVFLDGGVSGELRSMLQFSTRDFYQEQLSAYQEAKRVRLDARLIVTITVVLISVVLLYVTMRTSAIRRASDIAVFRLLGIKRRTIYAAYCVELLLLSGCTTIPAALLTGGILHFVASIRSLEMEFFYPWYVQLLLIAALCMINLLVGLLPIRGIVRLMPAKLAAKYGVQAQKT